MQATVGKIVPSSGGTARVGAPESNADPVMDTCGRVGCVHWLRRLREETGVG